MFSNLSPDIIESETTNSNLERGRLLYQNGHVSDFKMLGNDLVLAKVKGHKIYNVLLEYKDDNYKAYCNCLYEPKGQCKHQVAVKFILKDILEEQPFENEKNMHVMQPAKLYRYFLKYLYKIRYRFY